jgi:NADPH:quinone reductase-like Zn-dependent oxidoreductase
MKAIVSNPGGPVITAVDDPHPGSGEALVAIQAFSVNRGELDLLRTRTSGWRPGQDIAGVVAEQAADGSGPAAGARIVALVEQGGWAELAAVPVARLAPLPAGIGTRQAAALPLAGLTALRTLRLAGDLLGRRVLVTGANGGVGRIQIQLAALAGAEVTAVAQPQHEKQLLALGASSVVADPAAASGLYDLVADWVGGPSLAAGLSKAAPRGTVVLGSSNTEKTPVSIYDFFGHEDARLVSYLSYAYPEPPGPDLATLAGLVAAGRLDPAVGLTLPWTRLRDALTALAERRISGKAVLTIG